MARLDMLDPSGGRSAASSAERELAERLGDDYLLIVANDAVPLPGGLERMLEAARSTPDAALVVATAIPVASDGTADRERAREHVARHRARVARFAGASYVAVYGGEDVAVLLCRRSPPLDADLDALGSGGPAAMLERCVGQECAVLVDPVCARTASQRPPVRSRGLRAAGHACKRLRAHARVRRTGLRRLFSMTSAALCAALGLEGGAARMRAASERLWLALSWRILLPLAERSYDFVLTHCSEWPIGRAAAAAAGAVEARRVAYYIWRFPVLSETFIRRELAALEEARVEAGIIADAPGAGAHDDAELIPFTRRTRYVLPLAPRTVLRDLGAWLLRRPLRTLNLFAYTVGRPYNVPKSFTQDARVFLKAVHVASMLRAMKITHLHAPWGDTNAFVGMVAARLAGAEFSVQFRAQDLHRRTLAFLIAEKIRNARFVITNTRYNLDHLRALARPQDRSKIFQIYNGLELDRMACSAQSYDRAEHGALEKTPLRILSVARLIEPKGLPYLFEACRTLLDRGRDLRCRVVGGPELPLYVNDLIEIRRCRRMLGLEEVVELAGAQPFARVIDAYREADIFALPCVVGADASNDIIPNAILEAMAMGVPVVATSITAIPELIEDGETGLLVPPNDSAALADAIDRLIEDPALRSRLVVNARVRVAERFDVSKNVRAYVELFRNP